MNILNIWRHINIGLWLLQTLTTFSYIPQLSTTFLHTIWNFWLKYKSKNLDINTTQLIDSWATHPHICHHMLKFFLFLHIGAYKTQSCIKIISSLLHFTHIQSATTIIKIRATKKKDLLAKLHFIYCLYFFLFYLNQQIHTSHSNAKQK
jgi:hypothetical protein